MTEVEVGHDWSRSMYVVEYNTDCISAEKCIISGIAGL